MGITMMKAMMMRMMRMRMMMRMMRMPRKMRRRRREEGGGRREEGGRKGRREEEEGKAREEGGTPSPERTQDHLRITYLQQRTQLLPSIADHLRALCRLQSVAPCTHVGHHLFRRPSPGLEGRGDELTPRRRVAGTFDVHRIGRRKAILVGSCSLTRHVAAVCASHGRINKDLTASYGVSCGNVEFGLLHDPCLKIHSIPCYHPLLFHRRQSRHLVVVLGCEVAEAVMAPCASLPDFAF
jgi:hypothetical protein